MVAPDFVRDLLGWRTTKGRLVPNVADSASKTSIAISSRILELLDIKTATDRTGQSEGTALEEETKRFLEGELRLQAPDRLWDVERGGLITDFQQYRHLAKLDDLIRRDTSGTLSVEIGRDYQIRPDVTVGLSVGGPRPVLHAAVSCKFTIRSDRVQNIRHEAVMLTRHRRGRQPHIVAVTAEPLPSRLAAIARGTGELDAVYHVCLAALEEATQEAGTPEQRQVLDEITRQDRLFDLADLPFALATW